MDEDALKVFANNLNLIKKNFVLTPHSYEFFLLTGKQPTDNMIEREGMVQRYAKKLGCTILLKGNTDIISDGSQVSINRTGNPFMTKAGTGDILAGVLGALLARGSPVFESAAAAAFITGAAGDIAGKELGESL